MPGEVGQADFIRNAQGQVTGMRVGTIQVGLNALNIDTGAPALMLVSAIAPSNGDGRPNGTIYVQTT